MYWLRDKGFHEDSSEGPEHVSLWAALLLLSFALLLADVLTGGSIAFPRG